MRSCPHCQSTQLHEFSSLRKKQCSKCGAVLPWELQEQETPLVANNRKKVRKSSCSP